MRKPLLTSGEAAKRLGVCKSTLTLWRNDGVGPPAIRLSTRSVRYDEDDLEYWLVRQQEEDREWRDAHGDGMLNPARTGKKTLIKRGTSHA